MINHYVDGPGVHRGTIKFWGTSVVKCVSTRLKMSQGNIREIHSVVTI